METVEIPPGFNLGMIIGIGGRIVKVGFTKSYCQSAKSNYRRDPNVWGFPPFGLAPEWNPN
jgi:hypothetical protein